MKLAIIYHSETGNTKQAAQYVSEGMQKVEGVETACYSIADVTQEDISDAAGIVFGAPTYYAEMSWQMLQFMHTTKLVFADKLGGAFATANFTQGGSELVLQNLNTVMLAKGMTVYSGGTSHGVPFTHIGANAFGKEGGIDAHADLLRAFGEKFAAKAKEYFA